MAMRFSRVERGGEYVVVPGVHSKTAYITMMQVSTYPQTLPVMTWCLMLTRCSFGCRCAPTS